MFTLVYRIPFLLTHPTLVMWEGICLLELAGVTVAKVREGMVIWDIRHPSYLLPP